MDGKSPCVFQYQGSKRKLAPQILRYMPRKFKRLVEPFAGAASISIACALEGKTDSYIINDLNAPLVNMLREAVEHPSRLAADYRKIWNGQFAYGENHVRHFYDVRERFNNGEKKPANMLYLLTRCVKGSVRYGKDGNFNQSPDKRRHGTNPNTEERNIYAVSALLNGKAEFFALDYRAVFEMTRPGDLVYMDPPYQGVSDARDRRYFAGVPFAEFSRSLETLNEKGVDYLISYDGVCGAKEYGQDLPESLGCKKVMLAAGLSSQSLLLGRKSATVESLYISGSLAHAFHAMPKQLDFIEAMA